MSTGFAGWVGHTPTVKVLNVEQAKYERMWALPAYRTVAPGESAATLFLAQAKPKAGAEVIDFGTGTGRGALALALLGGLKVRMVDFAGNCLDEDVQQMLATQAHALSFTQTDLRCEIPFTAPYGYCTDVMEHIEPKWVDGVFQNILQAAQHVFFQIACEEDVMGSQIGEKLHLSVHPYSWWHDKLQSLGALIHFSENFGSHCHFYVTAWKDAASLIHGTLNVSEDQIRANVRANLEAGWQQISPHVTNDTEVMLVAGGPSLRYQADEIKRLRAQGVKLITMNGTYNWALEQGMQPSAQIVVDARAFNARFTKPVHPLCKYLIASQCDPSVLEGLPKDRTYLWHTGAETIQDILKDYQPWWPIPGGCTVVLRAIPLLRTLGFKRFHIFGFDSCLEDDLHHAYAQPENDQELVIPITCGERVFRCHAWMVSQAQQFQDLVRFLGDEIECCVYGNGLIAHLLETGAHLSEAA